MRRHAALEWFLVLGSPQNAPDYSAQQRGAAIRNSPDSYIRSLERASLNADQKWRLTRLVMSFFDDREQAGGEAAGDAA
jgi:hypothetical protein